jgi:hypothetical protein
MANTLFNVGTSAGGSGSITTLTKGDTIQFNVGTQGANWTLSVSSSFITSWTGGSGSGGTWNSGSGGTATLQSNGTGFKVPIQNSNSYLLGGTVTLFKNGNSWFTVNISTVKDATAAGVTGAITYSNATIAIGSTFTVTVTGNGEGGSFSYNQNGGASNNRFTPAPANYAVNATFGQFTATAINPSGGLNSNGAATGWYNLKAGGSGTGTTLSQGPNKIIYQAVVAPTASISLTSNNQTDGSFVATIGQSGGTTNGGSTTQYRFLNASNQLVQDFSSSNTYSGSGSNRPSTLKGQIREVGVYNTSNGAISGSVTASTIQEDSNFNVTNPSISSSAGSFSITITGASVNEQVQVANSNSTVVFEDWVTITNGTSQTITCNNSTINTTNLPQGQATTCRVRVRRPTAVGGDNSVSAVNFTVTRAAAPDGNITVNYTDGNGTSMNSTGIYNSANGNLTAAISNGNSNTQYRMLITSGSASPSGTVNNNIFFGQRTGNGNITIVVNNTQASTIQGDQASYRVEYREVGTSTWFNATGTRATFTLTHSVESPNTPIVIQNGAQSPTASITVQEAFSNAPPTDCVVEFNQAGGGFTTATGSPRTVTGYSQSRGTTVAYSARFRNATTGQVSLFGATVNNYFLTYLTGFDSSIVIGSYTSSLNSTLSGATGDVTIPYSGGSSLTEYRIESSSVSGTIDTDSGSSGSFLLDYSNNELPPDGASYTYFFQGRRTAATGGDPSGSWGSVTTTPSTISVSRANLTASDLAITVNGNSPASPTTTSAFTKSIAEARFNQNLATSDTIAIAGAQIGDQVRVIKAPSGPLLVDFINITSSSFNIVVPTSSTNFPPGTSNDVKVQIRRPNANNGNNVNATALTYTYQRALNQAQGRILTTSGGDITFGSTSTIGATAYIAAANGSTGADTAMDIAVSAGAVIGENYRIKVTTGTTQGGTTALGTFNASPAPATGTSFSNFLAESRLPNVNASVSYIYEAQDASATGDGDWYECYRNQSLDEASWTVTRSNYVAVDNILSNIVITGTGVQLAQNNDYIIAYNNTTVNPIPSSAGTSRETNQEYRMNNGATPGSGGENYIDSFGLGSGALTGSAIPNSTINEGLLINVAQRWMWTRVPTSQNGNNSWVKCSTGSVFVAAGIYRDVALISPTILSGYPTAVLDANDLSKIVPVIKIGDTASFNPTGNGATDLAWSTSTSTPSNWYQAISNDTNGINNYFASANFNLSKTTTTVYVGIRRRSLATGFTSTPVYASASITGGDFVFSPGGINGFGVLNQVNGNLSSDLITNSSEIRLFDGDTLDETVEFRGLSNQTQLSVSQTQGPAASIYGSSLLQSDYGIDVVSGTTQGGDTAGDNIDAVLLPSGNTIITLTLSNPGELPTSPNSVNYEFYLRLATSRGGNGVKQYPTLASDETEFSAKRYKPVDLSATASPAKTTLTATGDTTLNVTVAGGSSPTEYRLVNTTTSQNIADTQVGNGTITIQSAELPSPNSSASYKLQARLTTGNGGVGNSYQDTSPLSTFTLNRLQLADGTVSITVPNTTLTAEDQSNQIISLSQGNNNTQYRIRVTASTGGPSVNDVVGESIPTVNTTSFTLIPLTNELPTEGNSVDYIVEYREVGTSTYLAASGTNTTFTINRLALSDTNIVVNSVPANRFTISSQGSFSIAISDGNSNTDYRVVLVSQTGTNLTVGSVYGSRTGNGNITLSGTPVQGEFATYKIQGRPTGSSVAWVNAIGTNSTFTAGRYEPLSFAGSSGGSITDVPINSSVSTATVALSGVVGTVKVYVAASTGNATVKVIKNTDTPVTATNASPVNAVNGDIIGLQFTVGGGYSETSTATISIDQPLNTTLQFGPVFSITTEASPGGSDDDTGGGTGVYGLEVYDSSNDLILTNSDLVGDFCYSDTVSIANGGTTGISGVNTKGGNVVLILENLNPFTDNQRAEAVLENSGKQVRINLVDATASTALTFNVLVFQL